MKEIKSEYELIVSEGKLPLWRLCIGAFFFTLTVYLIYLIFIIFYRIGFCAHAFNEIAKIIKAGGICVAAGVTFLVTKTIMIDTDKDKLISSYCIGPFCKKVSSVVPKLEYVSVFLNTKGLYEVNIWYNGNRHYEMYVFDHKHSATNLATQTAIKLNIDLLDATEKGNSKWIDTTQL